MKQIDILMVGIGGYGAKYVNELLGEGMRPEYEPYRVVGAVQPKDAVCATRQLFVDKDIPLYETIDEFYQNHKADFAVISTPIFLHREHVELCISNGSNVLCEKPLCTSIEDTLVMKRLAEESGLKIFIGYQLSYARGMRQLKADIAGGMFGKPISFRTLVHYPRGEKYYARNQWAGKKTAGGGRLTLDSPLHNAVAHHLNNMLFLLGTAPDRAAMPKTIQAETYRANPIVENFDTVSLRLKTEDDVEVLFYTTHAIPAAASATVGPYNVFKCENATIFHDNTANFEDFFAIFNDGRVRRYEPYFGTPPIQKLWDCIDAIRGGAMPASTVQAAIPEVLCVNAVTLCREVKKIEDKYIEFVGDIPGERFTKIEGLQDGLMRCFDECKLLSEIDLPWAEPAQEVEVSRVFEEGFSPLM